MNLQVVTPPVSEPIDLATAKLQTRVDGTTDDALLNAYITAAREKCEEIARRAFATQTLRLTLDAWPNERIIRLPRPPLQSVSAVAYTDNAGITHTLSSSQYVVDTDSEPGRIALKSGASWPGDTLREIGGIKITYLAGYATGNLLPKIYTAAMLLLIAHLYENREAGAEIALEEIPFGVNALLGGDRGWY